MIIIHSRQQVSQTSYNDFEPIIMIILCSLLLLLLFYEGSLGLRASNFRIQNQRQSAMGFRDLCKICRPIIFQGPLYIPSDNTLFYTKMGWTPQITHTAPTWQPSLPLHKLYMFFMFFFFNSSISNYRRVLYIGYKWSLVFKLIH